MVCHDKVGKAKYGMLHYGIVCYCWKWNTIVWYYSMVMYGMRDTMPCYTIIKYSLLRYDGLKPANFKATK